MTPSPSLNTRVPSADAGGAREGKRGRAQRGRWGWGSAAAASPRSDPPAPSGRTEPGLPAAPALIGAPAGPPLLTCPAQPIGATRIGAVAGGGSGGRGDAGWRLSRPPRRVPSGPAPVPSLSRRLRAPRPGPRRCRAPGPRALMLPTRLRPVSAVWHAPRRRPERSADTASPQPPAARPPAPGTPRPRRLREWVGRARGRPTEAGCSRPSPTRCRPRRPWSRLTRTRWTSAPKCSSTACCGNGPSGGRQPSGPGGECALRAP